MNVLVFKTDIVCEEDKRTVGKTLSQFNKTLCWNVDLEDCEKILRIETATVTADAIVRVMQEAGFTCEELL